jgi:hypothetical protein
LTLGVAAPVTEAVCGATMLGTTVAVEPVCVPEHAASARARLTPAI